MFFPIAMVTAAWYFFCVGLQMSFVRPCTYQKSARRPKSQTRRETM
jgi:hypothetical protein